MAFQGVCQKIAHSWQTNITNDISNPVLFKNQDFNSLKKMCLQNRCLFEDDTFPPCMRSIGQIEGFTEEQLRQVVWKRPSELVGAGQMPQLFAYGLSRFDIFQGNVGDCWVLAALGSITFQPEIFKKVIPKQDGFSHNYAGIFHFRFWHFGQWIDVVIDDRLPVYKDKCLFVNGAHINEFWPALLEKAFAKIHDSYQYLHFGHIGEAFVDLSGGISMDFHLQNADENLWEIMKKAVSFHALMACSTPGKGANNPLTNGLFESHAYTVTGVKKVKYGGRLEELVRLWNPWGKKEWTGRWSDGDSAQWNQLHPDVRCKLLIKKENGEFWMSFKDFKEQFKQLCICTLNMDFLQSNCRSNWSSVLYRAAWCKDRTAGGSPKHETFWMNPQYNITVTEDNWLANKGQLCNVVASLMQKPINRKDQDYLSICFSIFKVQGLKEQLPVQIFTENVPNHLRSLEVTECFLLNPGTYVLVPFTLEKDEETEFILRLFFTSEIDTDESLVRNSGGITQMRVSESLVRNSGGINQMTVSESLVRNPGGINQMTIRESPGSLCVIPKALANKYENQNNFKKIFMIYAKNKQEIDASQLQRLLNEKVMHEHNYSEVFSIDSCRGIIALMDIKVTGGLTFHEFCFLWKRVMLCEDIFCKLDSSCAGYLESRELWNGLTATGILVSKDLLKLLQLRHGNSLKKIHFESFVCWLLRLECMCNAFDKLTKDGEGIYLTKRAWMNLIMSA